MDPPQVIVRQLVRARHLERGHRDALWVEPKVYCYVSFMERTRDGHLRAPVFEGIHGD